MGQIFISYWNKKIATIIVDTLSITNRFIRKYHKISSATIKTILSDGYTWGSLNMPTMHHASRAIAQASL
jgi:hypothetical protein